MTSRGNKGGQDAVKVDFDPCSFFVASDPPETDISDGIAAVSAKKDFPSAGEASGVFTFYQRFGIGVNDRDAIGIEVNPVFPIYL